MSFFGTVGSLARIGNWSDSDKIRITVLKLTDVAGAFFSSSVELKSTEVTWDTFKTRFLHQFRDVRPPHFHYVQHQTACCHKDEWLQNFADKVHALALKTIPKVSGPQLQKFHYNQAERMLLSSFIAGLVRNPRQQVQFCMSQTSCEVVQTAVTVHEAEKQESRNLAFFTHIGNNSQNRDNLVQYARKQSFCLDQKPCRQDGDRQTNTKWNCCTSGKAVISRHGPRYDGQWYNCSRYEHYVRQCTKNRGTKSKKSFRSQHQNPLVPVNCS